MQKLFQRMVRCFVVALWAYLIGGAVGWGQDLGKPLTDLETTQANQIAQSVQTADWLGPLTPIALSPYFGITCLAGMSQFGEGTFLEQNSLVSHNPVLKNPAVFWIFLVLTLVTSLPRLTKVSKPIAQVLDRLEMYSVIVTLIVIRIAASSASEPVPEVQVAGIGSISIDLLMVVAAAINVFVISTVRFVCELVVWLSPFPTIDALFEGANKLTCGALMALYAFSPLIATMVNLVVFLVCAAIFAAAYRRAIYLRSLIVDPVFSTMFPGMCQPKNGEIVVFNRYRIGSIPAKSRLKLRRTENGWAIRLRSWFGTREIEFAKNVGPLRVKPGLLVNEISLENLDDFKLLFSRRYAQTIHSFAKELELSLPTKEVGEVGLA